MKKLLIALLILGTINFTGCDQKSANDKAVKETSTTTTTTYTKTNNDKTDDDKTGSSKSDTTATTAKTDTTATTAKTDTDKATTSYVKQLGYVKNLYEESGSKYISIQYVQWLSGEEAIKAIMEDEKCTREEAQSRYTDDHYISDTNKEIKKVKVSNNATYSIIKTGAEATNSNFDEVKKELGKTTNGILCDVTIKDNEVIDLKQRYQP